MKTVLIVDGICVRGLALVRHLSSTGEYHIVVFSRDTTCAGARAASSLPNATLLLNRCSTGYDLHTFAAAVQRCPFVVICSSAANSEGGEGAHWGARLVQSAATAGAKHLLLLSMDRELRQLGLDNFIHAQPQAPTAWTIIRSPTHDGSERCLTADQLRSLARYVTSAISNPARFNGRDFDIPDDAPSSAGHKSPGTADRKRRDSRLEPGAYRVEGTTPPPAARGDLDSQAPAANSSACASVRGLQYLDAGRARVIQQWMARSGAPAGERKDGPGEEVESDDSEDEEESSSESE